ncbi:hypothetical protein KUTeg_017567 [Tegillarca granosa]|uniref:L-serine ammonia-lyase n=1 Tax=Tegillarca granosa TaxID=220873 RepID=A0ABQ9EFA7_TEGGR|nr:hypothetical protein KUTeg_017567 [Tegillarca granosa]
MESNEETLPIKSDGNMNQTISSKNLSFWIQQLPVKILQAKKRIEGSILKTPLIFSLKLSSMGDNCKVYLKLENEQITGSFKLRGAFNKMLTLIPQDKKAHACRTLGVPLHVFCRKDVDEGKKSALMEMGVKVTLTGTDCVDAENAARMYSKENQIPYVSPYNDKEIIAGQGTIGVEILEEQGDIDVCLVPVGGGGLISGIARYLKQMSPNIKVIGCQPENSKVMYKCVKANKIIFEESEETLSDGTVGGIESGSITFDLCRDFVDDWIMVSEEQIGRAIVFMLEEHRKVVEGAAGVAIGAYMNNLSKFTKKKVAIVCCGANISADVLRRLLDMYQ